MATQQSTVDYLLEQLSSLSHIRTHKMFGEYALYCDEKVVALVCDDQLFIKITEEGKKLAGDSYKEGAPYPGAKPYMLVDEKIEDAEWLSKLIRTTADLLPMPKPKKHKAKS